MVVSSFSLKKKEALSDQLLLFDLTDVKVLSSLLPAGEGITECLFSNGFEMAR